MKIPPFLLGTAVLLWGWQSGFHILALFISIALESSHLIKSRWAIRRSDWSKASDISTIIALVIIAFFLLQKELQLVYKIGKFLPLVLFPLMLAQRFSELGKTDISALSILERKKKEHTGRQIYMDIAPAYLICTLLAAGIQPKAPEIYYPACCLLVAWSLFKLRPTHHPHYLWFTLILLIFTIGYGGEKAISYMTKMVYEYSMHMFDTPPDPLRTTTSIGDIGRQKLSNKIIFRVLPESNQDDGMLLREAVYNTFHSPSWHAHLSPMLALEKDGSLDWHLQPQQEINQSIRVRTKAHKGQGILKLPYGAISIQNLAAGRLQTNALGTASFDRAQTKYMDYRVIYTPESPRESPPNYLDLIIRKSEQPAIQTFADRLQLTDKSPEEIIKSLHNHLDSNFKYTLNHQGKGRYQTELANFLLNTKAGQCEMFATATVLTLRAFGIPARYAIGYAVSEYSPIEKQFIVRQRHGHAWTRVFLNGQWQDLDTTSANWLEIEEKNQSPFRHITDFLSFLNYRFDLLRASTENPLGKMASGLILLLILLITIRLKKQKRKKKTKRDHEENNVPLIQQGLSSNFYQIEKLLTRKGYPRNQGEPLLDWADRLQTANPYLLDFKILERLIHSHYKRRFSSTDRIVAQQDMIKQLEEQLKTPSQPAS